MSYFKGRIQDLERVGMDREKSAKVKTKKTNSLHNKEHVDVHTHTNTHTQMLTLAYWGSAIHRQKQTI